MGSFFGNLFSDVAWGWRVARRSPGLTAFAVLSLAFGLGATTALFAAVQATLTASGTVPNPDEVVTVRQRNPKLGIASTRLAPANYFALTNQASAFAAIAAYRPQTVALDADGSATSISAAAVTPSFFEVISMRPSRGRALTVEDIAGIDRNGPILATGDAIVISHGLWQSRFGGRPGAIGERISLDEHTYTIVGVMPRSFDFPRGTAIWLALGFSGMARVDEGGFALEVIGRLKPGITPEGARSDLDRVSRQRQRKTAFNAGMSFPLRTLRETITAEYRRPLLLLFLTGCLVVAIIAVNLAAALLAKTTAREHEIAVRAALGASRSHIMRGLVAEGVVLAWLGGGLAIGVAFAVLGLLRHFAPPQAASLLDVGVNVGTFAFAAAAATILGAGIGMLPAIRSSGIDVQAALASTGAGRTTSRRQRVWQDALLVGQLAIAVALMDGTFLLYRSYIKLQQIPLGFANQRAWNVEVDLPRTRFGAPLETARFASNVTDAFMQRADVEAAAASIRIPVVDEPGGVWLKLSNFGQVGVGLSPEVTFNAVAGQYFKTLGIPVIGGRDFSAGDGTDAALVTIVSRSLAEQVFGNANVLHKRIVFSPWPDAPREIVGVVGDTRQGGLSGAMAAAAYIPFSQVPMFLGTHINILALPKAGSARFSPKFVQSVIAASDRGAAVGRATPLQARINELVAPQRFATVLIGLFGCLGLLLAMSGVAGITSHIVASRTQEIGIRIALGAERRQIARLVLTRGMASTSIGLLLGLVGAALASRAAAALIPGLDSFDPVAAIATSALAGLVALVAVAKPVRRALSMSPIGALRRS